MSKFNIGDFATIHLPYVSPLNFKKCKIVETLFDGDYSVVIEPYKSEIKYRIHEDEMIPYVENKDKLGGGYYLTTDKIWCGNPTYMNSIGYVDAKDQDKICEDDKINNSAVVHPTHYNWIKNIECMDVVKFFDFPLGNVIKYIWRAGYKSTSTKLEDLEKAKYYLDIAIEMEKNK